MSAFKVEGIPHGWERARVRVVSGFPRFFESAEQKAHKELVRWAAKSAGIVPIMEGAIGLDVVAMTLFPRPWSEKRWRAEIVRMRDDVAYFGPQKFTKPDLDNVSGGIMDALNPKEWAGAWADDAQVTSLRAAKVWGPESATFVRLFVGEPPAWARWWRIEG